ncbi:MAG TPA: D-arabinono-1,4-lactone oxidase [Methylomirabilota bacterium]|nr:D-arabinono-1,4-lactone oxidase [Methylomirabilota bacterium]
MPEWRNWSGSVGCRPALVAGPTSETEVAELVRAAGLAGQPVRVAASGHSFVPLCASDGLLLRLTGLHGVAAVDAAAGLATVWAGSTIQQLGPLLRARGAAMANMGDIDRQGIAGAVSTGTHGTGRRLGNISTQVEGLRLVTAEGDVVDCDLEHHAELFHCARVAVGALGVLTQVRLRVLPAYRLHERTWESSFDECLARLDEHIAATRHFEFFWRPRTDHCDMKALEPTEALPASVVGRPGERIGWSDEIFPTERTVRFNEMEFAIPESAGPDCLREIRALMRTRHPEVAWPIEYRTLAADDIPLSPAHRRASVTISVHQAAELPYAAFFADCETVFRNHRGRPHWGKHHRHRAAELRALYPEWERFAKVRRQVDPRGRFLSGYLAELLTG